MQTKKYIFSSPFFYVARLFFLTIFIKKIEAAPKAKFVIPILDQKNNKRKDIIPINIKSYSTPSKKYETIRYETVQKDKIFENELDSKDSSKFLNKELEVEPAKNSIEKDESKNKSTVFDSIKKIASEYREIYLFLTLVKSFSIKKENKFAIIALNITKLIIRKLIEERLIKDTGLIDFTHFTYQNLMNEIKNKTFELVSIESKNYSLFDFKEITFLFNRAENRANNDEDENSEEEEQKTEGEIFTEIPFIEIAKESNALGSNKLIIKKKKDKLNIKKNKNSYITLNELYNIIHLGVIYFYTKKQSALKKKYKQAMGVLYGNKKIVSINELFYGIYLQRDDLEIPIQESFLYDKIILFFEEAEKIIYPFAKHINEKKSVIETISKSGLNTFLNETAKVGLKKIKDPIASYVKKTTGADILKVKDTLFNRFSDNFLSEKNESSSEEKQIAALPESSEEKKINLKDKIKDSIKYIGKSATESIADFGGKKVFELIDEKPREIISKTINFQEKYNQPEAKMLLKKFGITNFIESKVSYTITTGFLSPICKKFPMLFSPAYIILNATAESIFKKIPVIKQALKLFNPGSALLNFISILGNRALKNIITKIVISDEIINTINEPESIFAIIAINEAILINTKNNNQTHPLLNNPFVKIGIKGAELFLGGDIAQESSSFIRSAGSYFAWKSFNKN